MSIIGQEFTHTCERLWSDETGADRLERLTLKCRVTAAYEHVIDFEVLELLEANDMNPKGSVPTTGGMSRQRYILAAKR